MRNSRLGSRSSRRPPRGQGFTLIELLVVIGIILLLVGLLTPSVTGILTQFRGSTCRGNMKQLNNYLNAYTTDNQSAYPALGNPKGLVDTEWIRVISKYNKHPGLLACPVAKETNDKYKVKDAYWAGGTEYAWKTTMEPTRTQWADGPITGGFAYNLWLSSVNRNWDYMTDIGAPVPRTPLSLAGKFFERQGGDTQEDTPVMADGYWMAALPYDSRKYGTTTLGNGIRSQEDSFSSYVKGGLDVCTLRRHSGREVSVLFVNGSARAVDAKDDLWKLTWHKDYLRTRDYGNVTWPPSAARPYEAGKAAGVLPAWLTN